MLTETGRLFSYRHAFLEAENVTRDGLCLATALILGRMKRQCNHYVESEDASVRTKAKRFLKIWEDLFVFLLHDGVEPTNNVAEQALRLAVQWGKICFGSKSEKGERFTERILTITRTCRMQGGRNPFEYLTGLVTASFAFAFSPSGACSSLILSQSVNKPAASSLPSGTAWIYPGELLQKYFMNNPEAGKRCFLRSAPHLLIVSSPAERPTPIRDSLIGLRVILNSLTKAWVSAHSTSERVE